MQGKERKVRLEVICMFLLLIFSLTGDNLRINDHLSLVQFVKQIKATSLLKF